MHYIRLHKSRNTLCNKKLARDIHLVKSTLSRIKKRVGPLSNDTTGY